MGSIGLRETIKTSEAECRTDTLQSCFETVMLNAHGFQWNMSNVTRNMLAGKHSSRNMSL